MNKTEALKVWADGKKVGNSFWGPSRWVQFNGKELIDETGNYKDFNALPDDGYSIVSEPINYSVDVWFREPPEKTNRIGLPEALFGEYGSWSGVPYSDWRKYRITVEGVPED